MESAPAATAAAAAPAAPEPASVAGAKISPKARRLAREHGVDIARLRGSGPGGEILADDILKAAQAASGPAAVPAPAAQSDSDSGSSSCCAAATSGHGPSGRRHLDRPHHGRADDAELDDGPAFLRRSRRRRHGPERDARGSDPGDREVARREDHAHRPDGLGRRACAQAVPADERQLGQQRCRRSMPRSTSRWRWRSTTPSSPR